MIGSKTGGLFGLALLSGVNAVKYGYNHVAVRRDPDIVAANFEDVDIKLHSPYFNNRNEGLAGFSNGTQGPTSHEEMESFMEEIASKNDYMTFKAADFTSEEKRSFPYVHLATGGKSDNNNNSSSTKKVRVWIQGATHGNEPAGDEAVLALLGKFDAEPEWATDMLSKLEILVLPRYNPDGVYYFQRTLAMNLDPNRDHLKLARQQTRDIKQLFGKFSPHVVVDMHEFSATASYGRYYHAADGLFSAAKNLNIHPSIRKSSEELFAKNIGEAMESAGLRWEPYVTGPSSTNPDFVPNFAEAGTDAKIGRNNMGLTQAVTFLIEMRGIFLANQEFQRRTAAGLVMCGSIVETAADNTQKVLATIEGGIEDFIKSDDKIVITDYSETEDRLFTMVDYTNGSVVQVPIKFSSTTPTIANLTRARPEAYIIPVAWADLAERLRVGGLEVETLDKEWTGKVEAYEITSTKFGSGYYEGVVRVSATTEMKEREITLPAGSFLVSTRQKNAALAFNALEPENIDSYVSFNIVPVAKGDEYPIFRVMTS